MACTGGSDVEEVVYFGALCVLRDRVISFAHFLLYLGGEREGKTYLAFCAELRLISSCNETELGLLGDISRGRPLFGLMINLDRLPS